MVLVTGASRGLGQILMNSFLDSGEKVRGTYQSTLPQGSQADFLDKVDVTNYQEVEDWVNKNKSEFTRGVTLINCAGISYNAFMHKAQADEWAKVINVNLIGSFNTARALLPFMRDANFGRIISISSVVAQMGVPGTTAYAASKAGLWGMAKSLAKECKGKNITVNTINLGYFDAGMIEQVPAAIQDDIKAKIPAGRFGQPTELFNLVNYIRSSEYVNGSNFDINGGLY